MRQCLKKGLREKDYREDNILWVPYDYLFCDAGIKLTTQSTVDFPLLGEKFKTVQIRDKKLEGNIYYIIAGHGGPDPGRWGTITGVIPYARMNMPMILH